VGRFLRRDQPADALVASVTGDAQRFLRAAAAAREDAGAIEAQIERDGFWEEESERIERLADGRYGASCRYHGAFSVEVADAGAALEAACVLGSVQRTVLEAIEWGSWPDDRRRRARTPGERYLRMRARDARKTARLLQAEVRRALRTPEGWSDDAPPGRRSIRSVTAGGRTAYHVEVEEDSLVLSTHAASPDRALAFMTLYVGLQRDLRRVLGWEPLAAGEV
jgi:hypothetical protein